MAKAESKLIPGSITYPGLPKSFPEVLVRYFVGLLILNSFLREIHRGL